MTLARVLLPALVATALWGQERPDIETLLRRLDRLEEQNRALLEEVRQLRETVRAMQPAPASGPTVEERLDVQETRVAEEAQSKVEASQRFPLRVTGMALFNAWTGSEYGGGAQGATYATLGTPASGGAGFRQSIIGLEYRGPSTLAGGKVRGTLELDLFGGTGHTLDQLVRLRTAAVGIDWNSRSLEFGLEKPIFNPRNPTSLAQVGVLPLSGAVNLWLWIPQVRFEQRVRFGESSGLRLQGGVVQVNESTASGYGPYQGNGDSNARPAVEGRAEFYAGSQRRIEIAPGFHRSSSHVAGASVPSDLISLDWLFRPWASLDFTGAFYSGRNVTPLGTGGIRQGFVIVSPALVRAVHGAGGWGQFTWRTTPRLSFNLFTGQQDDRDSDLFPGAISKNLALGGNFVYRLAPNVLLSFEATQFRTVYIGSGPIHTNHYDLGLAYLF